jgi:predicted nucleotidyltransferase
VGLGGSLPASVAQRIRELPEILAGRSEVVFAYLFGSAARGELQPSSDVDIAVFLASDVDLLEARADLIALLSRHLGTDRVDVVLLNEAPTALLGRILLDRRVLCDKEPFQRHRFESLALRQFHDFRLFERRLLDRRRG